MGETDTFEVKSLRFSDTPRGSPKVVNAERSPVHSIRPVMDLQHDHQLAMKSYMEDESSDEEDRGKTVKPFETIKNTIPSRDEPDPADLAIAMSGIDHTNYFDDAMDDANSNIGMAVPGPSQADFDSFRHLSTDSQLGVQTELKSLHSSFDGSVTEMHGIGTEPQSANKLRHKGHLPQARIESGDEDDQIPILAAPDRSDAILRAHALTIEALKQNEDSVRKNMTPPPLQLNRNSLRLTQPPSALTSADASSQISTKAIRKVSLLPPPIDVTRTRSIKAKPIPSPYPITRNRPNPRDGILSSPRSDISLLPTRDSTFHLRLLPRHPSRPQKTTTLSIPPSRIPDYSTIKTAPTPEKEKHFRALDYDDAAFASALRKSYATLVPLPTRLFAARSLARIVVIGHLSRAADRSYGWIAPRPVLGERRTLSASGYEVSRTSPSMRGEFRGAHGGGRLDEGKLLELFRRPKGAKARYAWVRWGRKIADAGEVGGTEAWDGRFEELVGKAEQLFREAAVALASERPGTGGGGGLTSPGSSPRVQSLRLDGAHQRSGSGRFSLLSPAVEERGPITPVMPVTPMTPFTMATGAGAEEEEDRFEGLQFVMRWDVARIVAFLAVVVLLAIAAALLWIFLGPRSGLSILSRPLSGQGEGIGGGVSGLRGAGDRLGAGVALGICVLLVGLTAFAGWMGVSWLVI